MASKLVILAVLVLLTLAAADINLKPSWIVPTNNGPELNFVANFEWPLGSVQKIQWNMNTSSYHIELWQQNLTRQFAYRIATVYEPSGDGSGSKSFDWSVQLYTTNLTLSNVYFFWLFGDDFQLSSHYFNISEASATTTSTTMTATASPQSSSISTPVPDSSTEPSNAATPAREGDSSANTLSIGLGVGLGVGIPLILIAGIWIGMKAVRLSKATSPGPQMQAGAVDDGGDTFHQRSIQELYAPPPVYEISANRDPVELPKSPMPVELG